MQDDVCIILNEAEPAKRQLANELLEHLSLRQIAAEKLSPTEKLFQIVRERSPKVIVLDYLLGDITTALDFLSTLRSESDGYQPEVIVWTDEPSVSVAVSAMKLGALDFVELRSSTSLEKVIAAIETALKKVSAKESAGTSRTRVKDDAVIAQSKVFQRCLDQARACGARNEQTVVVVGPRGSGKSTVARVLHEKRSRPGAFIEIDADTWTGSLDELFGTADNKRLVPLLSHGSTVVIDHAEFDTGEILEAATTHALQAEEQNACLVIGTSSIEVAKSWQRLTKCEVIEIPPLQERAEDVWPLIQHFLQTLRDSLSFWKLRFSSNLVGRIQKLEWKYNVQQLRSAVVEAVSLLELAKGQSEEEVEGLNREESIIFRNLDQARQDFERFAAVDPHVPDSLAARVSTDHALGNLRIAAARLGTGVPQLRQALGELEEHSA